jgi:hypothetical protein
LEQARRAFEQCIAQANAAPFDAILQARIAGATATPGASSTIETSCQAALEIAAGALQDIGEGSP